MYVPPAFRMSHREEMLDLITRQPLGLLISTTGNEHVANLIPFQQRVDEQGGIILRAHLARANRQWRDLDGKEVLVVFQGDNTYITPQWYGSKAEHGKVVPTWNYEMVQLRGRAKVCESRDWLHGQVSNLTDHHEAGLTHGNAWHVTDAPVEFVEAQLRGIVGVEIAVHAMDGKRKASQNRNEADREGVRRGLSQEGRPLLVENPAGG